MRKKIQGVKGTIQQTITIDFGKWPVENVTFQWLRNGRPIKGATQATYTTVDDDYNESGSLKNITCQVSGDVDLDSGVQHFDQITKILVS